MDDRTPNQLVFKQLGCVRSLYSLELGQGPFFELKKSESGLDYSYKWGPAAFVNKQKTADEIEILTLIFHRE